MGFRLQEGVHRVDAGVEIQGHVGEGRIVFRLALRSHAIRQGHQAEAPHRGVDRGVEHADVPREAAEDQFLRARFAEELFQRRPEKSRTLRLRHERIVRIRREQSRDLPAAAVGTVTARDRFPGILSIVHVDHGDASRLQMGAQLRQPPGRGQRVGEQGLAAREVEVVEHVDQQQGSGLGRLHKVLRRRVAHSIALPGRLKLSESSCIGRDPGSVQAACQSVPVHGNPVVEGDRGDCRPPGTRFAPHFAIRKNAKSGTGPIPRVARGKHGAP